MSAVLSRRGLLAGLTVVLFGGCALPVIPKRPAPSPDDALGWIRHDGNGRYTLWLPRVEMGQGIQTALKQVACAELDVGWAAVTVELPGTRDIGVVKATVGSDSIKDFALPLAQGCALLREAVARGGFASPGDKPPALRWPDVERPDLQRPPLAQGEAIVTGRPLFVADVRRPGMVFGRVLYAPLSPEFASAPRTFDEAAARAQPGFVALVRDERFEQGQARGIGIVAATPGALDRIERALAVQWQTEPGRGWRELLDIDKRLASEAKLTHAVHDDTVPREGAWDVDLRFDIPPAAHAAIEPRAAVAEFDKAGKLQLWVGSQDVFYQRDVVARLMGLDDDEITVHGHRVGGAFGGKTICTVELEAAVLARATGRPVKVQWTRAQEFRQGFHRSPSSHRVRVRLKDGRLQHWWHAFVSAHILFTNAAMPPWLQSVSRFIGDAGVARGARLPYRAAAKETRFALQRLPVLTGPWRGLGAGPNHFAVESAIDECARWAGQDPLAFRLAHVEDTRLARVLKRVAQISRWDQPIAGERVGRGLACGIYKDMSYAAVVADVAVAADGTARVLQMWCAHDCGRVVNAEQVRAQCEGNLVWCVGMVLVEQLPFEDGQVTAASFADSPIPRWGNMPQMHIDLVGEGDAPTGAGETAMVAGGAAIANALRAATGVRLLSLPWNPALATMPVQ